MTTNGNGGLYGIVAEFEDADSLLVAARQTREAGYKSVRAFTPYHVEGLADLLEKRINMLPYLIPAALFFGAFMGYILQSYTSVFTYQLNVGGRPPDSWPAFMLITFEIAILTAAFVAFFLMFAQNGLPQPYHPIFNAPNIETASHSRFFLCIEVTDQQFDLENTTAFLQGLEPVAVSEVQI
ncbi:MAG: DUF3341 domain-containing protein [Chloroflexi bacterium]|nr:DUF3341 domain-containing protein [Chloroflexota bacterium]